MNSPRLDMFLEFFNQRGIKLVNVDTEEEIKPSGYQRMTCPQCDSDTPVGRKCMWCQNKIKDEHVSGM